MFRPTWQSSGMYMIEQTNNQKEKQAEKSTRKKQQKNTKENSTGTKHK
jgi:hypothetical protein